MLRHTGTYRDLVLGSGALFAPAEGDSGCARMSCGALRYRWASGAWMAWRIVVLLIALAASFEGSAAASGWRPVMTIYGGPVNAVVVDAGGAIYAATTSGIFKSSDSGQTWSSTTGDLPELSAQSIAADPMTPGTLYVATSRAMFKTVNGGANWIALTIPDGTSITQIAVARSNSRYVYVSTWGSYVYRSTDGGTTWAQSSTGLSGGWNGPAFTTVMAVDPTNALRVYTGTWRGQLFRSDDGATTWQTIGGGGTYWIFQLAIAPSTPNVLWATNDAMYTSYGNILKSTDSGATWSNAGQPAGSEDGVSIAVDRSNPSVAYVATSQGLYKTIGNGIWTLVFAPPAGPAGLSSIVINPSNASQLCVGSTFSGPYLSSDGGVTWQQSINGFAAASISSIDLCLTNPSTMYAAAATVGLLKSVDGGTNWMTVGGNAGFQNQYLGGVSVNPSDSTQVLLSAGSNVWRSTNGGVSFSAVSSYSPYWLRFNPLAPANVMGSISDSQGGFLYSGSSGAFWTIPQSIYIYPGDYAFHPTYPNVVFTDAEQYTGAALQTVYVMWSNSGGNGGWQQSTMIGKGSLRGLALDQNYPTLLYVLGTLPSENTQGIYKFNVSYSGAAVSGVSRIPGIFNNGLGSAMPRRIVSNAATSTLYLTTDRGLFRSTDQAVTWVQMNTGLNYLSTDALAVTPDGNHAIVGTNGGVWVYDSIAPVGIATTSPLSAGQVNVAYIQTLAASGGTPPYFNWTIISGTQPPGLSLSSAGVLSGTATTVGTYNFTIRVSDSAGAAASKSFQLTISAAAFTITTPSPLPSGQVNIAYSQTVAATGGTPPYSNWAMNGTLPPGITISSAGLLSGTPTAAGTYNFTIQVSDSAGVIAFKLFQLTISAAAFTITTPSPLPSGQVNIAYTQTMAAAGGAPPYSNWRIISGTQPPGLSLSSAGVLSGTPTTAGTYNFVMGVSDGASATTSNSFQLTVNPAASSITTSSPLPSGQVVVAYSQTFAASGGLPPYSNWTITSGTPPPGLSLSATGVLSGTPSTAGTYNFTVRVSDSIGATASKSFQLTINSALLTITTGSPLPSGQVAVAYSQTLAASGGILPYSNWIITSGTLPPGLTLGLASGILSGTPTAAGIYNFTVRVNDSVGVVASASFQLTILSSGGGATLSLADSSGSPGGSVEVPLTLSSAGSSIAGFQADISFDQQLLTFASARKGDALSNAGKDLTTQPQNSGTVRLSAAGLNQNVIADGAVAYLTFTLGSSFPPTVRTTLTCSNSQGVSPQAQGVTISCRAGSITASACTCDVNKDGTVTVADVQLMINMALGLTTDKCDLNGDGQVNVADVQIVINAALGLGCGK